MVHGQTKETIGGSGRYDGLLPLFRAIANVMQVLCEQEVKMSTWRHVDKRLEESHKGECTGSGMR